MKSPGGLHLLLSCLLIAIPQSLLSQGPDTVWLAATAGMGASTSSALYDGSAALTFRLGAGVQVAQRLSVEGALQAVEAGMFQGETSCDLIGQPCAVNYSFFGGSVGLVLDAGPRHSATRIQFAAGAGAYRVRDDQPPGQGVPTVTSIGMHIGVEVALVQWRRGGLMLGSRGIIIPHANAQRLWFVPIELGIRFR